MRLKTNNINERYQVTMETMKAADTEYEKHSLRNIFTIEKKTD